MQYWLAKRAFSAFTVPILHGIAATGWFECNIGSQNGHFRYFLCQYCTESRLQGGLNAILAGNGICIRIQCAIFVDGGATCKRYYNVPPPSIIYKPSQKTRNLRRVAAKIASTFAKQAQLEFGKVHIALLCQCNMHCKRFLKSMRSLSFL